MIPYAAPRTLFSEVAPSAPDPHPKHPDRSPQFGAASGPVDIGGEQPEPAESGRAQNGHPMVHTRSAPARAASGGIG
jgi:hypothetical protein